jgi:hypothetical protein
MNRTYFITRNKTDWFQFREDSLYLSSISYIPGVRRPSLVESHFCSVHELISSPSPSPSRAIATSTVIKSQVVFQHNAKLIAF